MDDAQTNGRGRGRQIVIPCPAKLNLTLAVAAPREDGLHPLASIMVPIAFGDTLSLTRLDGGPSRLHRTVAADCPRPMAIDWPIEQDLAYRAHALLENAVGEPLPVDCELSKRIPTGAGLGGGSSNAAGMFIGLRKLFGLDISDKGLVALGPPLGADVAFAIASAIHHRPAVVTGIGEVVEPIDAPGPLDLVLIFPDGACPTGRVFASFDEMPAGQSTLTQLQHQQRDWLSLDSWPEPMNDLEQAAKKLCPPISEALSTLANLGLAAHLTGSGSTLFVLAETASHAEEFASQARDAGLAAYPTRFESRRAHP